MLEGFDESGRKPILRPAKTPITLKHLLTHTSGLCYDTWDEKMFRFASQAAATSPAAVGPLMFEPGDRWQYGQGVDWAGRLVEKISGMSLEDYFQARVLGPLEMRDTSYVLPPSKFDRMVGRWNRDDGAELKPNPRTQPTPPKTFNGGGGLYSTAADYVRFMQMILRKGRGVNNAVILQPKTVESMEVNQIGKATAGKMRSLSPQLVERRRYPTGRHREVGTGFPDQHDGLHRRPRRGKSGVGRAVQHLLLDRSEERYLRRTADAVPAVRGQRGRRPAERFRAGGLRQPGKIARQPSTLPLRGPPSPPSAAASSPCGPGLRSVPRSLQS